MGTIAERAKRYYESDIELIQTRGWLERSDIADIVEKAYIQGATEQKEIDIEWLRNNADAIYWEVESPSTSGKTPDRIERMYRKSMEDNDE